MTLYTPGPWWQYKKPGFSRVFIGSDKLDVAEMNHAGGEESESANAALVAEAPALLESCMQLLSIVEAEYEDDPEREDLVSWKRAIEQARKAINKAIGKE